MGNLRSTRVIHPWITLLSVRRIVVLLLCAVYPSSRLLFCTRSDTTDLGMLVMPVDHGILFNLFR